MRALSIPHGGELAGRNISITIGLYTCIPGRHTYPRTVFDGADAALYRAKAEGRDRYCADRCARAARGDSDGITAA